MGGGPGGTPRELTAAVNGVGRWAETAVGYCTSLASWSRSSDCVRGGVALGGPWRVEVMVTVDCVVVVGEDVDVVTVGGEGSVELPVGEFDRPRAARRASVAFLSATRVLSSSSLSSLSLPPSLSPAGAKGGRDRSKVCLLKLH